MTMDDSMLPIGEIVEKARNGEEQVWRDIVDRLYPWALSVARSRLSNKALAEDAVQEAFLMAFTHLHTLRTLESFPAWLATIIRSQCSQMSPQIQREASLDRLDDCGLLPMNEVRTPEDELSTMRLFGHFDSAVRSLPENLRVASIQHYLLGLSTAEIAQTADLPESTVKKRLHRARRLLQERMLHYRGEDVFRVGYMPISDHLLAMATEYLFRDRKLSLVQKRYLSWSVLADDLRRGRLDAGFIMVPLAMHLHRSGVPLLHVMDAHHDGSSLAVSFDGRIQCLGLPGPHSTHRALLGRLAEKRPELRDLTTQFINPSYALASMRSNKIDSFFCAEPWGTKCIHEQLGQILISSKDIVPGHTCCILAVRGEYAVKRGEMVRDYVSLLLEARDRTRNNPSFGAMIQSLFTGIALDTAAHVLEQRLVTFDDLKPDKQRVMAVTRMIRTGGDTSTAFDLDRFVCTDFF
jgi:NitT/TauT family transport system substrate-binding protein